MTHLKHRQINLIHELMYQLKVKEAMTENIISFLPSNTFREIQQCMKENKFSGVPIVENDKLMGVISIDDIITAFDEGYIDSPVKKYMVTDIVTVPPDYSIITVSNLFKKYRYGRLFVVDSQKKDRLLGVITYSDLLSYILLEVNSIVEEFEAREDFSDRKMSTEKKNYHFELAHDDFDSAGAASTNIRRTLKKMNIPAPVIRRIAVVCYEAEINVIIHSLGGFMEVEILADRIRIFVSDEGPGIPNLEEAMTSGYTTANEKIRALGFGAGLGLVNMKKCADTFDIRSNMDEGTEIVAEIFFDSKEIGSADMKSENL